MKKTLSLLLCLLLLLQVAGFALAEESNADAELTVILNADEFLHFAEHCCKDTYSAGKTFVLGADIDLSGRTFSPVPWFGGHFDGNGHMISGLSYDMDGSRQGLFRVVAAGAEVSRLSVSGSIRPGGTGCEVGGIVGVNYGTLSDCSFDGTVSGVENIGGIVGHNTLSGTVYRCTFSGDVTGEHQVAGIVGLNDGNVSNSANLGSINTVSVTPRQQPVDTLLSAGFDISQLSEDDFLNLSNIGGIAGDNTGIIDHCHNSAPVGYHSTGYNVGGITGKSSGFVNACRNTAEINGRRDVGGIVGQLIPFSDWDLSSGRLDALSWQLSILNGQLNNLSYNFDSYGNSIYASVERLRNYTADMTNALYSLGQYAVDNDQRILSSIRDSIYINPDTGDVSFTQPDLGNVDTTALTSSLSNMYGEASVFMDLARDATGSLASDIRRVSDQINNVFNELFSTVSNLTNVTPETDDLSETEAYSRNTGAIASCYNRGTILAENNCGGILGTAAFEVEFDMEDRLNISDYLTANSRHSLFASVRDCSSVGETEAKNGTVGGIAGNMDLGVITTCVVTGSVSATNGDYVGGLVGKSSGSVWHSWSRSLLSGTKYVGGVAGYAVKICNCRAWAHFRQWREYAGAVAGWVEGGPVIDNLFVSVTPGGVDGISISGESDALSEQSFLALDGVPEQFGTVTVRFLAEGRILSEETIPFGGSLRNLPEVPNHDGMYWSWELPDEEQIYTSLTVDGAYHAPRTTISIPGDPPVFLLEGQFYDGQEVLVLDADAPDVPGEILASYSLSVNDYDGSFTVRMLASEDALLYVTGGDGVPVRTDYSRDGSYIVFDMPNGGSLCYVYEVYDSGIKGMSIGMLAALALTPLLGIVVVLFLIFRARKQKRSAAMSSTFAPIPHSQVPESKSSELSRSEGAAPEKEDLHEP